MSNDYAIIAAHDQAFGIGKNNKLPWHIKGDLKFFQNITSAFPPGTGGQNAVIMGRNTWQSLPEAYKPLKGRKNVVLTTNNSLFLPQGVFRSENLQEGLAKAADLGSARVFVIGGAAVYKEAILMNIFSILYITEIAGVYDCDTFLPDYKNIFELLESSPLYVENNYQFRFKTYRRKK